MAIQTINIGYLANDGTGDDLREAFIKVNDNFSELESLVTNVTQIEITNIGTGSQLYKGKTSNVFEFKTLNAGYGVSLQESGNDITIDSDSK
jgi:hypothetical protein